MDIVVKYFLVNFMLKIFNDSYPVLRRRADKVEIPLNEEDEKLALDMLQHIKESQDPVLSEKYNLRSGVGLAAPQVGVSKQIIVVHFELSDDKYFSYVLANPRIISSSVKKAYIEQGEGCLSVDKDYPGHVYRYFRVKVQAYSVIDKKDIILEVQGYPAIVLQHEIDHINGILFYDHINSSNAIKYKDAVKL